MVQHEKQLSTMVVGQIFEIDCFDVQISLIKNGLCFQGILFKINRIKHYSLLSISYSKVFILNGYCGLKIIPLLVPFKLLEIFTLEIEQNSLVMIDKKPIPHSTSISSRGQDNYVSLANLILFCLELLLKGKLQIGTSNIHQPQIAVLSRVDYLFRGHFDVKEASAVFAAQQYNYIFQKSQTRPQVLESQPAQNQLSLQKAAQGIYSQQVGKATSFPASILKTSFLKILLSGPKRSKTYPVRCSQCMRSERLPWLTAGGTWMQLAADRAINSSNSADRCITFDIYNSKQLNHQSIFQSEITFFQEFLVNVVSELICSIRVLSFPLFLTKFHQIHASSTLFVGTKYQKLPVVAFAESFTLIK